MCEVIILPCVRIERPLPRPYLTVPPPRSRPYLKYDSGRERRVTTIWDVTDGRFMVLDDGPSAA